MQNTIDPGWDTEQAAILAKIIPATNQWLKEHPLQVKETVPDKRMESLQKLVETYESTWPSIIYANQKAGAPRSRAAAAMTLVLEGRVAKLKSQQGGDDLWAVDGHVCSKAGMWCDCEDQRAPEFETYGKLCKHRLAVGMVLNWKGIENPALLKYFQEVIDLASGRPFDIIVKRQYVYEEHADGILPTVGGYWVYGTRREVRLSPVDEIPFTIAQLQNVIDKAGVMLMELPIKLQGWSDYIYRFSQTGDGLLLTPQVFSHKGRTWKMEDRERSRRIDLFMLAMYMEELVKGPIKIQLSEYETKRVFAIAANLRNTSAPIGEIWAEMPEAIKIDFLETNTTLFKKEEL